MLAAAAEGRARGHESNVAVLSEPVYPRAVKEGHQAPGGPQVPHAGGDTHDGAGSQVRVRCLYRTG